MSRLMHIPNTLARWPWPRRCNPLYEEVATESTEWMKQFNIFPHALLEGCKAGLLAALGYPDMCRGQLRVACDLMHVFYVFEEQTDVADPEQARRLADISVGALQYPQNPRPNGEPIVGEVTRQFWSRALAQGATPSGIAHFVRTWEHYVYSCAEQARDRTRGRMRTIDDYFALRRGTVGASPCYALALLYVDMPPDLDVSELPVVRDIHQRVTDMIILDNDLLSYAKEYAAGDDTHNLLTIVMREKQIDLDAAVAWLAAEHAQRGEELIHLRDEALSLSFEQESAQAILEAYVDNLVNWPRANVCFTFESERYFGKDGERVQREWVVKLKARGTTRPILSACL